MAARKEILADLSTKIADGKMREAYRTFEELPVVDQIAVSISPGVGDAIAAYEVGEFGRRAKTNIESGDRLGAAGNIGLSALAGVSLIPLFRFLRGAKGVTKSGAKTLEASTKAEQPPVEAKLTPSAPKDSPLPEVEPFQQRPLAELDYRTGGGLDYQLDLGSKTRKWLNGYEQPDIGTLKPSEQSKTVSEWIAAMKADNLPEGELKLLRLIDPDGSPSTRLLNETAGSKTISRGFLDDYMQRAQRDSLQVRSIPNREFEHPSSKPDYVNANDQRQTVYFMRGTGEYRSASDHYSQSKFDKGHRGNSVYVFDGDATTQPGARYAAYRSGLAPQDAEKIDKAFENIDLQPTDNIKEVFRIQSDFQKEAHNKFRDPIAETKRVFEDAGGLKKIKEMDVAVQYRLSAPTQNRPLAAILKDFIQDADNNYSDLTQMPGGMTGDTFYEFFVDGINPKLRKALLDNDVATQKSLLGDNYEYFTKGYVDYEIPSGIREETLLILKQDFIRTAKQGGRYKKPKAAQIFKDIKALDPQVTDASLMAKGYKNLRELDDEVLMKLIKELLKRRKIEDILNEKVVVQPGTGFIDPKQQAATMKKLADYNKKVARIQEIQADKLRGIESDPDEVIELLDGLDQEIMDLGVTEFSITPREIQRVTGRPFAESLDKSKEEIYFMTEGPQGGRQKYFDAGPRVEDRVRAYFDDIVDVGTKDIEIANGVKILKKAVAAKTEGLPQGPNFKGGRDRYTILPMRTNILKAYKENADGVSIMKNQALTEARGDVKGVMQNYKDASEEIKKVLKELGVDEKGVLETVDSGSVFDGTYLKFTPELLDAISKRGINAFKDGGVVEDNDLPNVEPVVLTFNNHTNNPDLAILPKSIIRYLPLTLQNKLKKFEKINGNIYLPKFEVQQLAIEAEAQMISEEALRNDPHGREFHGGDPELRAPITKDPKEIKGRQFRGPDDIYGSKPNVYRSAIIPEEGDTSPIFYPKYLGEGVGFDLADQYKPGSPRKTNMEILGYYDTDLDEIGLPRTTDTASQYPGLFDNIAEETEAHEYIHRYGGQQSNAIDDHEYIEKSFEDLDPYSKTEKLLRNHLKTKEQIDIMKNMSSFEKNYHIYKERNRIFNELTGK